MDIHGHPSRCLWLVWVLSLFLLLLGRDGTWTVPQLDWDEGTRLSIGSALNHGRTLYVDAWDHHTFLDILYFQQLFRLFPVAWVPLVVRLGNGLVVMSLCLLVYAGVASISRTPAWAVAAAVVCGYLLGCPWALSSHGEFYHALPVALAFYWTFTGHRDWRSGVLVGGLFAVGFYTKQTAAFDLAAFAGLVVVGGHPLSVNASPDNPPGASRSRRRESALPAGGVRGLTSAATRLLERGIRDSVWMLVGFVAVTVLSALYFLYHGSLSEAAYMTFVDPLIYATGRGMDDTLGKYASALTGMLSYASQVNWVITGGMVLSLALLLIRCASARTPDAATRLALGAGVWLVVDALGLMLIGRFYAHYLVQLVVPAAIFSASYLLHVNKPMLRTGLGVVWGGLLVLSAAERWMDTRNQPADTHWAAVQQVVDFIRENTGPPDAIYLYQDWALCLYYLSERFPPTPVFMDHQLLPENKDAPGLLKTALARLAARPPKFIVIGDLGRSVPEIETFIRERYSLRTNFGSHQVLQRKPEGVKPIKDVP